MSEENQPKLEDGESKGESELSTEQLLDVPNDELKEKYGIEDGANWKSYQRALHKEQKERADEREQFQTMLDDRDTKFTETLNSHKVELESLKPKPKEDVLEPPIMGDTDDPLEVIKYLKETVSYNNKLNEKKFEKFEKRFGETEQELAQEKKFKEDAHNLEVVKSTSKGIWMKEGMTAQEADECWNWQATVKADNRIETIGKMFKISKGNGSNELADELKKREEMKMGGAPPAGGQGGASTEANDPNRYSTDTDHSDMYKTKK